MLNIKVLYLLKCSLPTMSSIQVYHSRSLYYHKSIADLLPSFISAYRTFKVGLKQGHSFSSGVSKFEEHHILLKKHSLLWERFYIAG